MFETIADILRSIGKLIPRLILIRKTEKGIKFMIGGRVREVKPGLVIYWPLITDLEIVAVVRQTLNLPYLTLMTKDKVSVVASGVIVYSIIDTEKYLVENYDAEAAISEVGSASLRDVIVTKTLADIQENNRNTTENALIREAKDAFASFGIEVEYVRLTDFSTARILNIVTPGSSIKHQAHDVSSYL